ncbi:MAG: M10 family metallopeptidase C-terminal domain-containing protein, partial [Alphaproteobacteria bacterium]|nr:M10 family metallopeptidase C-terminal domain-containing protein [Alphaproteobacteria bacterium]
MPDDTGGFSRFTAAQISIALQALQAWTDVANIAFSRADDGQGFSDTATILFGNYSTGAQGAAAFAHLPGDTATASIAGDIWVNRTQAPNFDPAGLSYGHLTLVHEIGHAIGLSHPSVYNERASSFSYGANADYHQDSRQYTVMSYFSETSTQAWFGSYPTAPMLDDIAAAQRLYGVNITTRTGDTVYGFNSNADRSWFAVGAGADGQGPNGVIFAVWDAGGTDTLDFSGYAQKQIIDLRQGSFSNIGGLVGNVAIARGAVIENATGGFGDDQLIGNSVDNILTGNGGNDALDGGLGVDTAVFSGSRSEYSIMTSGRVVTVSHSTQGADTITNVEFLRFADLTLSVGPNGDVVTTGGASVSGDVTNDVIGGSGFVDTLFGSGGNDTIYGFAAADTLNGGSGDDFLFGGEGDDSLIGGTGKDTLDGGDGVDLVNYADSRSGVTVNLAAGTASSDGDEDSLVSIENVRGTSYNDVLIGNDSNNVLVGNGGADAMYGGRGNDSFHSGGHGVLVAPDIVKAQSVVNSDRSIAVSMDAAFNETSRPDISQSFGPPHATVTATSGGAPEWYSFTATARAEVIVDIDAASFDSVVRVYDASGALLATNDDGSTALGGDLGYDTDSALTFVAPADGIYFVEVSMWVSNTPQLTTQPPPSGGTFTLHVSVPRHPVEIAFRGSAMFGEEGDDTFYQGVSSDSANSGRSDDVIDGGDGADTVVYSSSRSSYTVTTLDGVTTVGGYAGQTGTDTLTNIEFLQFGLQRIAITPAGFVMIGTAAADIMNGADDDDVMESYGGDDYLYGADGDDTLNGGAGNDTLIGGTGLDAALYSGVRRQYEASSTVVSGNGEGADTLTSIEQARFVDGVLTFDASSQSAQVMRLYSAALNRTPDQAGLEANVAAFSAYGL